MWKAISGFFGRLFGGETFVNKSLEMIDEAIFTDQEKSASDIEIYKMSVKAKTDILKAYEPFKLAQRLLVFMLVAVVLMLFISAIVFVSINQPNKIIDIKNLFIAMDLDTVLMLVFGFYFAGGALEGIIRSKNQS